MFRLVRCTFIFTSQIYLSQIRRFFRRFPGYSPSPRLHWRPSLRSGATCLLPPTIFGTFRGRRARYKKPPSIWRNGGGDGRTAPERRVNRNGDIAHAGQRDARIPSRLEWAERCPGPWMEWGDFQEETGTVARNCRSATPKPLAVKYLTRE